MADVLPGRLRYSQEDEDRLRHGVQTLGFGWLPDAIVPAVLEALDREATSRFGQADVAQQSGPLHYRANIAPLGPQAAALLAADETRGLLSRVLGQPVALSETMSCLTVYREGDYLGPHVDQPAADCAVTLLVYIHATSPEPLACDTGLVLKVYGEEPRGDVQARLSIPTRRGSIVVGRGASVWHERPRLLQGECVVALTSCFAIARH